jgi:hypothetical protein
MVNQPILSAIHIVNFQSRISEWDMSCLDPLLSDTAYRYQFICCIRLRMTAL